MWYTHTHTHTHTHTKEYYSTFKKKDILPFVTTRMKEEGTMLSEISWIEKEILHAITCR